MSSARSVEQKLKSLSSDEKRKSSMWFFKTGEGQYGFGDKFYGVTVPDQRKVSREFKDLSLSEITQLLKSEFHECRLTALFILVIQFKNSDEKTRNSIAKFYLANLSRVNNWDLVDSSASYILGQHLKDKDRKILYNLATSKNLWKRRVSIISTFAFIDESDFEDAINIAQILLNDKESLIHKAVGWVLREVGKKSKATLNKFLDANAHKMPRTALRYSLERFEPNLRSKYMKQKA